MLEYETFPFLRPKEGNVWYLDCILTIKFGLIHKKRIQKQNKTKQKVAECHHEEKDRWAGCKNRTLLVSLVKAYSSRVVSTKTRLQWVEAWPEITKERQETQCALEKFPAVTELYRKSHTSIRDPTRQIDWLECHDSRGLEYCRTRNKLYWAIFSPMNDHSLPISVYNFTSF